MTESRTSYRFGPLERRGLLGGASPGQAMILLVAAVSALITLDEAPTPGGLLGSCLIVLGGAGLTRANLASRPLPEWVPLALRFATRRCRGRLASRSRAPLRGQLGGGRLSGRSWSTDAPPGLRGLTLLSVPHAGNAIGVIAAPEGTRTAVLACRGRGFRLLDPEAQERRLAAWGDLLASAGGGSLRRVQWIERTFPEAGDELAGWLHHARDPSLPRGSAMVESYLELISSSARVAQEHEVLLAIQLAPGRSRSGRAPAGEDSPLGEQLARIAQALHAAEITVLGALSPEQLENALRGAFDPYGRAEARLVAASGPAAAGPPWPLAARESWDGFACDGALHATFWIAAWPRTDVSPLFMDAVLGRSRAVRAVSVCFEPLAAARSTREVEAALTRDRADRDLRRRLGQLETARQRQAQEAALRREQELSVGHGEVRFSGFVTVSGRDQDELRIACGEVLEQAARARLELRRMYGQQAEAFTFTLPLGRGLR